MPYIALDSATAQAAPGVTLGAPRTSYGKTLAAMELEIAAMLLGRTDIDSGRIRTWINDAYLDVCSSLKLPQLYKSFSIILAAGQPFYKLPEGVFATQRVSIVDADTYSIYGGRPLGKIDAETYRREMVASGEPEAYFRQEDMLVLYPTPNSARTIAVDARIEPQYLVADTDSPILPRSWHEIILKAARAKAHSALTEFEMAAAADNEWISLVRRKEDPTAEEDSGRLVMSSVPKSRQELFRRGGSSFLGGRDGLY